MDSNTTSAHRPASRSGPQTMHEVTDELVRLMPVQGVTDNVASPGTGGADNPSYALSSAPITPKPAPKRVVFIPTEDVETEDPQLLAAEKAEAHAKAWPAPVDLSTFPRFEDFEPAYRGETYVDRVISHVASYALRWLNEDARHERKLTVAELRDGSWRTPVRLSSALADYIEAEGRDAFVSAYDIDSKAGQGETYLLWEGLSDFCDARAAHALSAWDPEFTSKLSEAGRKGGLKSRRGPKISRADFEAVAGYSKRAQAEILGVSTRTVARYRASDNAQVSCRSNWAPSRCADGQHVSPHL